MTAALARIGAWVRERTGWRALLLAWGMGLVSALAFAPIDCFPFLLIGYAALVLLLDGAALQPRPLRRSALLGWAFGFGQFLAGLYWVGYAFMVDPDAHGWQMPIAIAILTAGLALFPALATWIAAVFWRANASRLFVLAATLAITEWLRGHVFTGFPWNLAAYGWGASLGVLQSAAVIGAYGLTLLTILFGASLAELFNAPPHWRWPAIFTTVFALLWIGGDIRLVETPQDLVPGIMLRLVQPNIPQAERYARPYVVRNWDRLLQLSVAPSKTPITHLIWPEAAPPFLLEREPVALDEIAQLTAHDRVLITGTERAVLSPDGTRRYYNSLYIFAHGGALIGTYDKFHLVPFGEYVPFASLLNRLGVTKLTPGEVGFSSGDGPHTYKVPGAPSMGPLICYEILFPGAVIGESRPGWFVNVTDDSWFGPSSGPDQHLLVARTRAIEEGIPVARDANTGISAVIDPLGRIVATLPLDQMGALDAPLPSALDPTLYARFGDLAFWTMVILSGLMGWALQRK